MKVTVPEVECRKDHIDLVDPNHPLLTIAFDCLQDLQSDRPSAQQICERVAALKKVLSTVRATKGQEMKRRLNLYDMKCRKVMGYFYAI